MEPRISFVTLGVRDLERATRFYADVLCLPRRPTPPGVVFFEMGRTWLALYPSDLLAADAGVPAEGSGFPRFALAHNVRSREEVDRVLLDAVDAGAELTQPARLTSYGGYAGCFRDPDGHVWEIAHNPGFHLGADGTLTLPDFTAPGEPG